MTTVHLTQNRTAVFLARLSATVRGDPLAACLALACIIAIAARLVRGLSSPMEFDETFTMVIASQRTFGGFGEWVLGELGGPLYYAFVFAWEKLVGPDEALMRLPSVVFSLAPAVIILRSSVVDRRTRLIWAALMLLWPRGVEIGVVARSYSLLALLTTAQTLAFIGLLRAPVRRTASVWVGISALAVLTHYHASVIALVQGLIFVARDPRTALRCWPAALLLLPVAAWGGAQFGFLMAYAKPGSNWYSLVPPGLVWHIPVVVFGLGYVSFLLVAEGVLAFRSRLRAAAAGGPQLDWPVVLAVLSGVVAVAIVVAAGCIVPSFTPRYLVPYAPDCLLGVACLVAGVQTRHARISSAALMLALCSASAVISVANAPERPDPERVFSIQPISEWIVQQGAPRRLVLLWDNPTADIEGPVNHVGQFGGYFIRRAGLPLDVLVPRHLGSDSDPNVVLPALATRHDAGFLWIYDVDIPNTRAIRHPYTGAPAGWRCKRNGHTSITVVACLPEAPAR